MSEFLPLREAVDTLARRAPAPDFGDLQHRAAVRRRRRVVMVAAATAAVVAGSVLANTALDGDRRTLPAEQPKPVVTTGPDAVRPSPPVEQPTPVVDPQPVWYDAKGLHRGDVVQRTPVKLTIPGQPSGALALVRTGAVYLDPAKNDVWFHPWGGKARLVGHQSTWGPGGDPHGDTAAWFEGSSTKFGGPGELVVYDTAAGREVSRTPQENGLAAASGYHLPDAGNGFHQVSAERVVWRSRDLTFSHDVRSGLTSPALGRDSHGQLEVSFDGGSVATRGLVLRRPGQADTRLADTGMDARLSPSGDFLLAISLAPTAQGALIVDTRTGDRWRVPQDVNWSTMPFTPQLAWSYGDIAMLDYADRVLACDAARRTCEPVQVARPDPPLMPTN